MGRTTALVLLLTLTAACVGDRRATDPAASASAAVTETGAVPGSEALPGAAAPAEAVTPAWSRPASAEELPLAADSAAALAEDVSPEWKMRTRQMAPFADCMEKTRNAPESVRPTLVEACHRLPDAPERP